MHVIKRDSLQPCLRLFPSTVIPCRHPQRWPPRASYV
uniref:Ribonucleotide reductase M1 n=1 Tax=Mus musculus TaxID=10090 RepID=A0A1B0GRW5_MOUSE